MKDIQFLPNEDWATLLLVNYVGTRKYAVSNHGRVVSYTDNLKTGRLVAVAKNGKVGDLKITDGTNRSRFKLHQLVAKYFLPSPHEDCKYVLHLDKNNCNNNYENLIYANYDTYRKHLSGKDPYINLPLRIFPGEELKTIETGLTERQYAITSLGRLIGYTKNIENGMVVNGSVHNLGYKIWKYKVKGKAKHWLFHRMVAAYFLEKPSDEHKFVIHLDHVRTNNSVKNLKWVTQKELQTHNSLNEAVVERIQNFANKTQLSGRGNKLTVGKVMLLKKILKDPKNTTRKKMLAKQFGISSMQLYRIQSGQNWGWAIAE